MLPVIYNRFVSQVAPLQYNTSTTCIEYRSNSRHTLHFGAFGQAFGMNCLSNKCENGP